MHSVAREPSPADAQRRAVGGGVPGPGRGGYGPAISRNWRALPGQWRRPFAGPLSCSGVLTGLPRRGGRHGAGAWPPGSRRRGAHVTNRDAGLDRRRAARGRGGAFHVLVMVECNISGLWRSGTARSAWRGRGVSRGGTAGTWVSARVQLIAWRVILFLGRCRHRCRRYDNAKTLLAQEACRNQVVLVALPEH